MKLRTERKDIANIFRLATSPFGLSKIGHDAAAAHALLQAMNESQRYCQETEYRLTSIVAGMCDDDGAYVKLHDIQARAAELMAEWGFLDDDARQ